MFYLDKGSMQNQDQLKDFIKTLQRLRPINFQVWLVHHVFSQRFLQLFKTC